ncbi:pyridoxamine 5'-phosphate oxidase family protein [Aureliella helgolandensis]|uniref:Pyridoxamine 5'-phosphate oxidase n=1 Tax=Aureliella helgolandensis TaxID=2527968 RepID=A0A518G266_9BACT|nr:pyridoxamine 5'-phosphate oxidase family protein [Aureliella helgolandensis]QDV22703.1 Pyridoxamine 5'-phosphate oxidase [Aureliella helgolandensis]
MSAEQRKTFIDACKQFDQAMLVTHAPESNLIARPMFVAGVEDDGDIWFATDSDTQKVDEIANHPEVCVTMSGGGTYLSISGTAEVVEDRTMVEAMWSEPWRVWFPQGPQSTRIALIRVNARFGELWSNSGVNRLKYVFKAVQAYAKGTRPDLDESQHSKVKL